MLIQKSVELKIDLNSTTITGKTAFHLACQYGQLKIVKMLMFNSAKHLIDLNQKDEYGWTAFHWACYWGKPRIVEIMIEQD